MEEGEEVGMAGADLIDSWELSPDHLQHSKHYVYAEKEGVRYKEGTIWYLSEMLRAVRRLLKQLFMRRV